MQEAAHLDRPVRRSRRARPVAITGGAGFIGCNLAHRLATDGQSVLLLDNLSRPGVEANLRWLQGTHGDKVRLEVVDVRDRFALKALEPATKVFHLAAQPAATGALADPLEDFDVNVRGTLALLETLRALPAPPPLVYASTTEIYGSLADLLLEEKATRYQPCTSAYCTDGLPESTPLDFHNPYACSKGAADQYVLDYARTFHLPAVVLRLSCVYGPHQGGSEDQGWVAQFLQCARRGEPVTLCGNGKQVRDLLFVNDLVEALLLASQHVDTLSGQAFNLGGGPDHTLSVLELFQLMTELHGQEPKVRLADWRAGEQRYYVSDFRRFQQATGWAPKVGVREGLAVLDRWLCEAAEAPAPAAQTPPPASRARLKVAG